MVIVLDACSLLHLVNAQQSSTYLDLLKEEFKAVWITAFVRKEAEANQSQYIYLYDSKDIMWELWNGQIKVDDITMDDEKECATYVKNIASKYDYKFKRNGEFYSAALSVCLSRSTGPEGIMVPRILFTTDEARGQQLYEDLISFNQVGKIVDSLDLVLMLYVRNRLSHGEALSFCNGLIGLYHTSINQLKQAAEAAHKKEQNELYRSSLSKILHAISDGHLDTILKDYNDGQFSKLCQRHYRLEEKIVGLEGWDTGRVYDSIRARRVMLVSKDIFVR